MSVDLQSIKLGFGLLREALDSVKVLKSFFERSGRDQIATKLAEANGFSRSANPFALSLGCKLCKYTFPPQIMLRTGRI